MFIYILFCLGQRIASAIPLKLAYSITQIISDIRYIFARADRQAVTENLKSIFPEKSDAEISRIRIRIFRNFAKYLTDFLRYSKIDASYIKKNIRIENIERLDSALQKGKGVIIVSAHLGNWELGALVVAQLGYSVSAVALPHKHPRVDNFFNAQRLDKGIKVIPVGKAVKACLAALSGNDVLALVGDRDFTGQGAVMPFFGRQAIFPEGPAAFALKTSSPIIPAFMLRNPDDTFTLKIESPIEFKPSGDKKKDIADLMAIYKDIFEDHIRRAPEQWFIFRRFWVR